MLFQCYTKIEFSVSFSEGFVLLWKKGDEILVVGEQVIKEENKRRFQLVKVST